MKFQIKFLLFVVNPVFGCVIFNPDLDSATHLPGKSTRSVKEDASPTNTTQRLLDLRGLMRNQSLSAFLIPIDDQSRLSWISGFTGSAGSAIVTLEKAALWTDSRYFLQAEAQLDSNWILMKLNVENVPDEDSWLLSEIGGKGGLVGADPSLKNAQVWLDLEKKLSKDNTSLVSLKENLIDEIWTEETGRPPFQPKCIVPHPIEYSGKAIKEKLSDLRSKISSFGATAMVVSELDEIAWLFNLRGEGDSLLEGLLHTPTFQSLALVDLNQTILWIHMDKVSEDVKRHLSSEGCDTNSECILIQNYSDALEDLKTWAEEQEPTQNVILAKSSIYLTGASFAIYECFPEEVVQFENSPILSAKAIKNEVETEAMISTSLRDAVALSEFFAQMEEEITNGKNWTEISASQLLSDYRKQQPYSKGDSFKTISAYGEHASVVHYSPTPETDIKIETDSLYLVDSGGQYGNGGTTDVTRTMHYGIPDPEHIEMYTRVLMGAIDLAQLSVPIGAKDVSIDVVARQHLFKKNLNYGHGTGHGIGSYLAVHEGPINLGFGADRTLGKIYPNFFFSDEPGFYKAGKFGIRLETILRAIEKNSTDQTYGKFMEFEAVTLVPFEPKLIDFGLMSPTQIQWLNTYNHQIRNNLAPILKAEGRQRAYDWVIARTDFVSPSKSNEVQRWANDL